jgi:tRNA (guanine37-N1)-methyltransferase
MRLYIGLVHYPVYNKNDLTIASAVTTLDLHDMSRLSRTYGVKGFYVITPLEDQRKLVDRVKTHWIEGYGSQYNRFRKEAIELVRVASSLEQAVDAAGEIEGEAPVLMATDAATQDGRNLSFEQARRILRQDQRPVMVIFGTAWGLDQGVIQRSDYVLDPIVGRGAYNHLSVRSAAAIVLDRLAGPGALSIQPP